MSLGVKQPEAGDDRNQEAEVARLQEMFDQPSYEKSNAYESDAKETPEAGIGDYVLQSARYPSHLGRLSLSRRVHIAPTRPPQTPPANYLG